MGNRKNAAIVLILIGFLTLLLPFHAPGSTSDDGQARHGARPGELFLAGNAMEDIALAKKAAKSNNKLMLVVMGGNWCHDSRALASRLYEQPLDAVIKENYETVFVDVGYLDKGRDVITSFGIPAYYATPTVLIVDPDSGQVINDNNRHQWANASEIGMDDSVAYFQLMASTDPVVSQADTETSEELRKLQDEIAMFEQRQADRLYKAYAVLSPMLLAYKNGEKDESFDKTWSEVRAFRYRVPADIDALETEAIQRVSAGETDIRLDYPIYPAFEWENKTP